MESKKLLSRIDIDESIESLGVFGIWHLWVFFWVFWLVAWRSCINVAMVFLQFIPDFVCESALTNHSDWQFTDILKFSSPLTAQGNPNGCLYYHLNYSIYAQMNISSAFQHRDSLLKLGQVSTRKCPTKNIHFHIRPEELQESIVTQWKLVCDRAVIVPNAQLAYVMGFLMGCFCAGFLADRYGRKTVVVIAGTLACVLSVVDPLIPNVYAFMVVRFLMATSLNASTTSVYVLAIELCNDRLRKIMGGAYWVGNSLGYVILAAIAYATKNWISMHIIAALPIGIAVFFYWFLPESPRWLVSQGRDKEAIKVLEWASRWNRKELVLVPVSVPLEKLKSYSIDMSSEKQDIADHDAQSTSFFVIFKYPRLIIRTINLIFQWVIIAFVYYGVSLLVTSFSGSIFINNAISGIVELPACLITFPLLLFARKKSLSLLLFVCGLCCVLYIAVPRQGYNWALLFLAFSAKLCIHGCFNLVYIVTFELYPTSIRTAGLAWCSMVGRLGSIVSPYVVLIAQENKALLAVPMVIFGIASVISAISCLFLPESQNQHLPDNVQESVDYPPKRLNTETGKMEPHSGYGIWAIFEKFAV